MDYEDMDAKIKEHHIHVAVFCNPHNPCGRVWERWEIEKAMEVYKANDCVVISDEIWSDLILEGYHHTPAQSETAPWRCMRRAKPLTWQAWWEVIISFTIPIFVTG